MTSVSDGIIILGAGLAGLGASYNYDWPIYESSDSVGGISGSVRENGYVFDFGIHILQSKSEEFAHLMEENAVGFNQHNRKAEIYSFGSYAAYPFQVNTCHLPLKQRLNCVLGYLLKGGGAPTNYKAWLMKNFGKGFARTFLIPYSEKFWRVPPEQMTYEWTQDRVPRPKLIDVIKGAIKDHHVKIGTNPVFQYPSKKGRGFAAIAEGLASKLNNIHFGMTVTRIDPVEKKVYFNNTDDTVSYDYLIATNPLPELIGLLPDVPESIKEQVEKLNYNSIAAINLGIDAPHISDNHWIHFPESDISFFRICFQSNFAKDLVPDGKSSIQAEVSYDRKNPPSKKDLIIRVREDLVKVGVLKPNDKITFESVTYMKYGYVIYDFFRKNAVARIHNYLNGLDIYPCGRYGAWQYLWSDEAAISGMETAKKVFDLQNNCVKS